MDNEVKRYIFWGLLITAVLLGINFGYHNFLLTYLKLKEIISPDVNFSFGAKVFISCIMPAVVEETAFRGAIQTSLGRVFNSKRAILISALMFAIVHVAILSWPYLFLMGVVLGYIRLKSQSIVPVIVIHFVHNFVIIITESI